MHLIEKKEKTNKTKTQQMLGAYADRQQSLTCRADSSCISLFIKSGSHFLVFVVIGLIIT